MKNKKINIALGLVILMILFFQHSSSISFAQTFGGPGDYNPTTGTMNNPDGTPYTGASTAPVNNAPAGTSAYRNQEKIPGFGQTSSFPDYLKQIVNFGFAAIGIMAMFMLMIGAYQYLMAAGNIAKEESAKTTISSAFSGLVLGLVAFLLLQTINPDLVSFNLSNLTGGLTGQNGTSPTTTGGKGTGNGSCTPVQSGPCSEASLSSTCFGSNNYQASSICNAESGGGSGVASKTDITADGRSFSIGLFQVNLTQHAVGGLNCPSAFSGKNRSATVSNESLYQQCVQAAQDPATNISTACGIGNNGSNWKPWGANSKCGF